ncbi:MAG: cell division ATP-binding protein FtsE [Bacillota bacterium]|nr:cell division ATP-binding protein FtsE [Bacillota bacterium]
MIQFLGVSKRYPNKVCALSDVSLKVSKGEFVFLVGPSGAGKSTLIKMIYHEEAPTEGDILVAGWNLAKIRRRDIPLLRRSMGVVFQDFRLLPDRTVFENVAFALKVIETPRREVRRRTMAVLDLVGLRERVGHYPPQLSGGEQQRVALARAIVNNPPIVLADEPTGNLDPETSTGIFRLLEEVNFRGATVVVATHAKSVVDRMRKRVVAIEQGKVTRDESRGAYDNGP